MMEHRNLFGYGAGAGNWRIARALGKYDATRTLDIRVGARAR